MSRELKRVEFLLDIQGGKGKGRNGSRTLYHYLTTNWKKKKEKDSLDLFISRKEKTVNWEVKKEIETHHHKTSETFAHTDFFHNF